MPVPHLWRITEGLTMTDERLKRLQEYASKGEIVLFLGAGALVGSTIGADRRQPLLGDALRDCLQDRFFKEEGPTKHSLKRVCTNIQNIKGKDKFREALTEFLTPVNPSKGLLEIPRLSWRAIYTTNVDDAIERAYENSSERTQDIRVVVLPEHREARNPDKEVSLFKLHGCLRHAESNLIFTHKDYTVAKEANLRLFSSLSTNLCDSPFLFVGFSFEDDDFQNLWHSITEYSGAAKRRHPTFVAQPSPAKSTVEAMALEGVDVLDFGTETIFTWLRANIGAVSPSITQKIQEKAASTQARIFGTFGQDIDPALIVNLSDSCFFVRQIPQTRKDAGTSRFLYGTQPSWDDIQSSSPIRRDLEAPITDEIQKWLQKPSSKIALLKGAAGYGKSTLLMQLAWNARNLTDKLEILFLRATAELNNSAIAEYARALNNTPLLVVIDDAYRHLAALHRLKKDCEQNKLGVFILCATRTSDWAVARRGGDFEIPASFDLAKLSEEEATELAKTMKLQRKLSPKYGGLTVEKLAQHYVTTSERHLIAALLTSAADGTDRFEEIVADEYFRIADDRAKRLYMTVCLIHAIGLEAPAHLVCAAISLKVTDYHSELSSFLLLTILEEIDEGTKELLFRTQHRVIAESLIKTILKPATTVDLILNIARTVNPHNRLHYEVLKHLYHEDYLNEILENPQTIRSCYEQFLDSFPSDAFIKQHFAIFESHSKNFARANQLIDEALAQQSRDPYLLNTKANILLREAVTETDSAKAEYLLNRGTKLLRERIEKDSDKEIHYLSLIDKQLNFAKRHNLTQEQRLNILEELETDLSRAKQHYPNSSEITTLAAKLNIELRQIPNAEQLLLRSVKLDGANTRARVLLARMYIDDGRHADALSLIDGGLEYDPNSYGLLRLRLDCLRKLGKPWSEIRPTLGKYLNVAENDLEERLKFIKGLMDAADIETAKRQLKILRNVDLPYNVRLRTEFALTLNGSPMKVEGTYSPRGIGKGYVQIDNFPRGMEAYLNIRDICAKSGGAKLFDGKRVHIALAVNGYGLKAIEID